MDKTKNYQKMVLDILSTKPIAFNPVLAKITGSVKAGLFLSQLLYWQNKGDNDWIYKTIKEIEEETALTRKEQDGAIKRLKDLGILEVDLRGVPPKRHFKINSAKLIELCEEYGQKNKKNPNLYKTDKLICTKGTNLIVQKVQNNTYNTTENTSYNLNIIEPSKNDGSVNLLEKKKIPREWVLEVVNEFKKWYKIRFKNDYPVKPEDYINITRLLKKIPKDQILPNIKKFIACNHQIPIKFGYTIGIFYKYYSNLVSTKFGIYA